MSGLSSLASTVGRNVLPGGTGIRAPAARSVPGAINEYIITGRGVTPAKSLVPTLDDRGRQAHRRYSTEPLQRAAVLGFEVEFGVLTVEAQSWHCARVAEHGVDHLDSRLFVC